MNARVTPSAARAATGSQHIEWLGIHFAVPGDWQIIRHALQPKAGRLVVVDRRRERCSLIWTDCPERPDLDRLVDDARARASGERAAHCEHFGGEHGWRGFVETSASSREVRTNVVRWDSVGKRLIELVATSLVDDAREDVQTEDLIGSVRFVAPPGRVRRWRAFDVDVTVPAGFRLVRLEARPADATFTFRESGDGKRFGSQEVVVRRMGMAEAWHDGDLERLARLLEPEARIASVEELEAGRLLATGVEAGRRYRQLVGLLRTQRTLLWRSSDEDAIYAVTTRGKRSDPLRPADVHLGHPEETK